LSVVFHTELLIGTDHMLTYQEMNTERTTKHEMMNAASFTPILDALQPHMILGCEAHPVCEGSRGERGLLP
jgi:hypothetical protein